MSESPSGSSPDDQDLEATGPDEEVDAEPVSERRVEMLAMKLEATVWQGPVPSPASLAEYEKTLPGCADRLIALTENQSSHRQEIEKKMIDTDAKLGSRGQIFAFIIAMTAIVGGIVLIALDKDVIGFVTLLGTLATLLGVFVYSQWSRRQNDADEPSPAPSTDLESADGE